MANTLANRPRATRRRIVAYCAVAATACGGGCARTVLVPEGAPIRIGPNASAHVYTFGDGVWTLSPNRVTVPEGWYVVPPSFVDAPDAEGP